MELSDFYYYDREKLERLVERHSPSTILIQLPEGLKHFFPSLVKELRSIIPNDVRIALDGSPIWGSCLIDVSIASRFDLILHFGHIKYPYWSPPPNVVFIDLKSKNIISKGSLRKLSKYLKLRSISRVGIYGTAQHNLEYIANYLRSEGLEVVNDLRNSTILGCWYSDLPSIKEYVDSIIIVSGGSFHSVGAGLILNGEVPIINLDPYRDSFKDMGEEIAKVLRIRYFKISESSKMRNWVIIVGGAGQYRPHIIKQLENLLSDKGRNYYEVHVTFLTNETLGNIDNNEVDVYVVTSCPRLPIDDLSDYLKPVLTPGEAEMALTSPTGRYVFPW